MHALSFFFLRSGEDFLTNVITFAPNLFHVPFPLPD